MDEENAVANKMSLNEITKETNTVVRLIFVVK